ncbi:MAG: FecR domain-containing protein [Acidobacteriota bacterium]
MTPMKDVDALLDRAASQISNAEPDATRAKAAAERVLSQLSADNANAAAQAAEVDEIRDCDDFQALIPAYLEGTLPEARRMLLEDHTRSCVPCRRALKLAREGETAAPAWQKAEQQATPGWQSYKRWALAAALIAGIGLAQFTVREMMPFGSSQSATVHTVDGDLFRIAETSHVPIAQGEPIAEGEMIRTGRTGSSIVRLNDGSLIEVRQRSEMRIEEGRRGTTIALERGSVIVQAAEQRQRHLFVKTDDCEVSVTGTIFSVNHGTKGSRVSVIEGEVVVAHSGEKHTLHPGQQVATDLNLDVVDIPEEISWSRDVNRYLTLLEEYSQLRQDLAQNISRPGLRYSSQLLDLAPENSVLYAALPNLGETIEDTHRMIQERIDNNEVLAEWWSSQGGGEQFAPEVDEIVTRLSEFGEFLGDEIAVVGYAAGSDDFDGPLVMAEIVNAAGLQDFVERQLAEIVGQGEMPNLVFVEDPFAPGAGGEDTLFMWFADTFALATGDAAQITRVANIALDGEYNPFVDTDFYGAIAELYEEGTEIIVAADLADVVNTAMADETAEEVNRIDRLGFLDVQHLLVEQKKLADTTHHRASLSFTEARKGLASWLAPPAPMGALDFVSADAHLVGAFVFKDPVTLMDDLYGLMDEQSRPSYLSELEQRLGFSLRGDVAESLGGEFAVALDGPLLPTPSWKAVIEVYDPARLQWALEESVAELNTHMQQEGKDPVEIVQEEVAGRLFYSMESHGIGVHYTFVEGYMLIGPNRALLDRAIRFRDSGYSIADSARFTDLLPADGRNNFSALLYQDLAEVMQSVAERLANGQLSQDQQGSLDALTAEGKPMLGYAYGEENSILVAASSENDALTSTLLYLLGVKNPAGLEQLLQGI